jgi:betaine-aldehyde dehydrogenase
VLRRRRPDPGAEPELSVLETYDTGKPLSETLVAMRVGGGCAGILRRARATLSGEHIQLGGDFVYTRREPLGVCVGSGLELSHADRGLEGAPGARLRERDGVQALRDDAAGGAEARRDPRGGGGAGGLYNCRAGHGRGRRAAHRRSPRGKVSITGSVPTGTRVYEAARRASSTSRWSSAASRPRRLRGRGPRKRGVGGDPGQLLLHGQVCSNGTRVFVQRGLREAFLGGSGAAEGRGHGRPLGRGTNFGPMVASGSARSSRASSPRASRRGAARRGGRGSTGRASGSSPRSSRT